MSEDIKELAQWLRAHGQSLQDAMGLKHVPFRLTSAADALEAMAGEVDKLQMKLAACGAGALANTERTVAQRITKESPYWSASLGDVYHIVDKEMEARAERDRLKAAVTTHVAGCVACSGSGVVFLCPERDDTAEAVREDCEECVGLRKALGGDA